MSTKNGKKSRNRSRHDDHPILPVRFTLDEIPLPSKPLKITTPVIIKLPTIEPVDPPPTETVIPIILDTSNGNSSRDKPNRSNTPQKLPKKGLNGSEKDELLLLPNGSENGAGGDNLLSSTDSSEVFMEPLILDSNEPEPELLNLGGGEESDSPDLQVSENKRCSTRRSQTRYIPTPETPHGDAVEGTLIIANEEVGQLDGKVVPQQEDADQQPQVYLTAPIITVTPSTPTAVVPSLDTSSTHESDTNLSDSTNDNCSTHAVVGSDVTRMNMDEQLNTLATAHVEEENTYAEIAEVVEERREDSRDGGRDVYEFEERPRSREGSIARALTGRKSIRPGTDYRKYLLERGMGSGAEGSYTTLGYASVSSSSGIKRKTTLTDFSTSTPNTQLKRRKLDTTPAPNPTFNWFAHISQSLYNLKNRFTLTHANAELPQTNATPTLTAYKSKASLEEAELEDVDIVDNGEEEDDNVSLGVDAMEGDTVVGDEKVKERGEKVREIPVEVEGRNRRKSCAIM